MALHGCFVGISSRNYRSVVPFLTIERTQREKNLRLISHHQMSSVWRFLAVKANGLSSHVPPPDRDLADAEPRKILMVHAHPLPGSFSAAVASAVVAGAADGAHSLRRVSLYGGFYGAGAYDPVLRPREREVYKNSPAGKARLADDVKSSLDDLYWCDTLIFVYPTWWFNVPAMLKGWVDRTFVPGAAGDGAFDFPGSGTAEPTATGLVPRLTNIQRVAGFSTYGATRTIALAAGDNGRNMIATALRPLFAPDCICRWHGLYAMDASTAEQREQYLQQVREIVASKL